MEKMIQAVFDNEVEAFEGLQALQQLDLTKDISIGETYVLSKDEDGKTSIRFAKDEGQGAGTLGGGLLGGLIGLLAGPLGLIVGVAGGMIAGSAGETLRAESVSEYLDSVSANIPSGKSVLVAHIWEDWETAVDTVLLPLTDHLSRFDLNNDVYVPAKSELNKLDEDIAIAETKLFEAEGDEKIEWSVTLADLQRKRTVLQTSIKESSDHQERQYQAWIDRYQELSEEHDNERRLLLEKRIREQKVRLAQLKRDR